MHSNLRRTGHEWTRRNNFTSTRAALLEHIHIQISCALPLFQTNSIGAGTTANLVPIDIYETVISD